MPASRYSEYFVQVLKSGARLVPPERWFTCCGEWTMLSGVLATYFLGGPKLFAFSWLVSLAFSRHYNSAQDELFKSYLAIMSPGSKVPPPANASAGHDA